MVRMGAHMDSQTSSNEATFSGRRNELEEWDGLTTWRKAGLNTLRTWGEKGPTAAPTLSDTEAISQTSSVACQSKDSLASSLVECALQASSKRRLLANSPSFQPHILTTCACWAPQVLHTASPYAKASIIHRAWKAYSEGAIPLHCGEDAKVYLPPEKPARPEKPVLVPAKQVRFKAFQLAIMHGLWG